MQIETKTMGRVEVSDERIINIPQGLFGFEEYTDFALVDSEYEPLLWLQSLQEKNLAFLLIDPFLIADDYEAEIDDKELSRIGIKEHGGILPNTGSSQRARASTPQSFLFFAQTTG